ncbi:MAG TPA: Hsp20/alpha crystallin family protein [Opitutaceae bacterium]|nr:Hsp20/alpha crystallin family protein [Opitutaceae bacterium]
MYRIIRYSQPRSASLLPALANRLGLNGLETAADRLFEAALADFAAPALSPRFPVDLFEDKDNTYVRAEIPGFAREDINVEMVQGYLNLTASRKDGEQSYSLNRSIAIPEQVQADKVSAAYENGVLTVTLPKQEQTKPRKIAISVS